MARGPAASRRFGAHNGAWRNQIVAFLTATPTRRTERDKFFSTRRKFNPTLLAEGLLQGKRTALSRAITMVESHNSEHQEKAFDLFEQIAILLKGNREGEKTDKKFRVGITGPPGAGKSTFIASLGMHLLQKGHKVAVLAIDPSSTRTGGSLLGDKTRMHDLSLEQNAYIRPSPSGGHLGGIAHATSESATLCEAAGYDVCLIETVGVGQSETAVSEIVDLVLLIMPPAAGDDIQGMKKGIVEIADLIVVNKADGALLPKARHTKTDYQHALQLLRPKYSFWNPRVLLCSSLPPTTDVSAVDKSIVEIWDNVCEFKKVLEDVGEIHKIRKSQREQMMWKEVHSRILSLCDGSSADQTLVIRINKIRDAVIANQMLPRRAARAIMKILFEGSPWRT
eukprot:jgi/Bigna1/67034/fgenesh1_pg.2_\